MSLRNTDTHYGTVAILLHWLVALVVIGLFALGLYMVELDYYDPWYKRAPDLHRAIGVLLFVTLLLRLGWRLVNPEPAFEPGVAPWEQRVARLTHGALYLLLFLVMLSGYLISTADGRAVPVFGWFEVPALVSDLPDQADIAGDVHLALAIATIVLASFHALGALKHHFIDRDNTLLRMLGSRRPLSDLSNRRNHP